jgi:ATP adenylyltransferase/5',5'''-P-1,P-4-tetraphosphate phosphorylase II
MHLSGTHTLLLNKFNIVAHHVLVVTRAFEPQTDPLNLQDFAATWAVVKVRYPRALTVNNAFARRSKHDPGISCNHLVWRGCLTLFESMAVLQQVIMSL